MRAVLSLQSAHMTLCPVHHFSDAIPAMPVQVDGSPYGGNALCEQFPRPTDGTAILGEATSDLLEEAFNTLVEPSDNGTEYWAQVGKADNMLANYDNIFQVHSLACTIRGQRPCGKFGGELAHRRHRIPGSHIPAHRATYFYWCTAMGARLGCDGRKLHPQHAGCKWAMGPTCRPTMMTNPWCVTFAGERAYC